MLAVALVPMAFPFLHKGFPLTHDGATHVVYVYRLDRALHQGQFPVRWVEASPPGRGQPLFNYYQVGFSYLVAAVHEAIPHRLTALKTTTVLLWWSGAAFMFLLCRRFGPFAAAAAAGVFALSPYLVTDVFVRGALPEFAAVVFAAGSLWTMDRFLLNGSTRRLSLLALVLAATATCHLAASLILAPVFGAHILWLWIDGQTTSRRVAAVAAAGALAVGLAAFYVGPAMLEIDLVQFDRFTKADLDYRMHFVPLGQLVRDSASYRWSYGGSMFDDTFRLPVRVSLLDWLLLGAALAVVAGGLGRRPPSKAASGLAIWLCLFPLAVFMMSADSLRLWKSASPLALIQFPWKFFMLLSFASGLLAALLVSALPRRGLQALAMVVMVGLQIHFYSRHLHPASYGAPSLYDVDRPGWREDPAVQAWDFNELALNPVGAAEEPDVRGRWTIGSGAATVREIEMLDHRMTLDVETSTGIRVTWHTPYFPGWVVRVDGVLTPVQGRPDDLYMDVDVPPGRHVVEAKFEDTPVRAWSNRVSLLSLLVAGVVGIRRRTIR